MWGWFLKRTILAVLVAAIIWVIYRMTTITPPEPKAFYRDFPQPAIFAHRGGAGLWPENTLFAFRHAWALGVDVLEMDVHATRDGYIVVIHDDTVDRTTNGSGRVGDMTLAEIQALDAGYRFTPDGGQTYPYRGQGIRIPTLEEVFDAFPNARFNIEVKSNDPPVIPALVELVRRKHVEDRIIVGAFDSDIAHELRARLPHVATFATQQEATTFWLFQTLRIPRAWRPVPDTLQVPVTRKVYGHRITVVTPRFVRSAHRVGVRVDVWTINDPDEMARLLDMGVDGIMTDYPDKLLELFRARGLR